MLSEVKLTGVMPVGFVLQKVPAEFQAAPEVLPEVWAFGGTFSGDFLGDAWKSA